jgi:uncharacterized membrane protein
MPPGNLIWIDDEQRVMLAKWHQLLKSGALDG